MSRVSSFTKQEIEDAKASILRLFMLTERRCLYDFTAIDVSLGLGFELTVVACRELEKENKIESVNDSYGSNVVHSSWQLA
jgi:hypothetical protein